MAQFGSFRWCWSSRVGLISRLAKAHIQVQSLHINIAVATRWGADRRLKVNAPQTSGHAVVREDCPAQSWKSRASWCQSGLEKRHSCALPEASSFAGTYESAVAHFSIWDCVCVRSDGGASLVTPDTTVGKETPCKLRSPVVVSGMDATLF